MIEYTVMDYEGEPVTIEDGEISEVDTPRDIYDADYGYVTKEDGEIYWDSDDVEWKFEPYDFCGNDRKDYGMGWYDCNTDWRRW